MVSVRDEVLASTTDSPRTQRSLMILRVDPESPTPPYEQLRSQLSRMIRDGSVRRGTRLPTIRSLATDLELAPNTVARAYRELEEAGLVVAKGRRGTFVAESDSGRSATAQGDDDSTIARATTEFVLTILQAGHGPDDVRRHVEHALSTVERFRIELA